MRGSRPLTPEEVDTVAKHLKARDCALFLLGCYAGLRVSELLALTLNDVYTTSGQARPSIYVRRATLKGKSAGRSIPVHPKARAALEVWAKVYPAWGRWEAPVFLSLKLDQAGEPKAISRVQAWRILVSAFLRSGLAGKLGTHCMRKTFAKGVYDRSGKDLIVTQKALGHTSVATTTAYLSFADEDVRDAILGA